MTTNWIAVYGITNSSAGTFPRQNPCSKNPPQFFFCFHSLEDVPFCFFMQVHTLHLLISSGTMGEFHNPHPEFDKIWLADAFMAVIVDKAVAVTLASNQQSCNG